MTSPISRKNPGTDRTSPDFVKRVGIRALLLFIAFNFLFAIFEPIPQLGKISFYNTLLPGRYRLPYGENPKVAYNLNLYTLSAMFASHELAGASNPPREYRILIIGDSSTWGFLLEPSQTIPAYINQANLSHPDGRQIKAYNLGYPVMSLTKDLLILSETLHYQPDLIIWPLTLESFPRDKQLFPPLLQNNGNKVRKLIEDHHLNLDPNDAGLVQRTFWQRTIVGARRDLADLVWLQLYGVMWAATGIDQDIPTTYTPRMEDLTDEVTFHGLTPPNLGSASLAFDVLQAGIKLAGETPILLVNEPMFISQGKNSDIRYNFYYPRWAYDNYRTLLHTFCSENEVKCLDLWDSIPAQEFTNSAVHLTPLGNQQYAWILLDAIKEIAFDQ